jgi:hypothetical protein
MEAVDGADMLSVGCLSPFTGPGLVTDWVFGGGLSWATDSGTDSRASMSPFDSAEFEASLDFQQLAYNDVYLSSHRVRPTLSESMATLLILSNC